MINWTEEYSTGFGSIDEQHKDLFRHINELEKIVQEPDKLHPSQIMATLVFLESYCESHFQYEEKCMHKFSCSSAGANLEAHAKFLELLTRFQKDFKDHQNDKNSLIALSKELYELTSDWIRSHICKIDVKLRDVKLGLGERHL